MQKRIPIRYKLLAALLVPVVAVAGVTFTQVRRAGQDLDEVRTETNLALATGGPGTLITQLMQERDKTSVDLIGMGAVVELPVKSTEEAQRLTDKALVDFRRDLQARGAQVTALYGTAVDAIDSRLPEIRDAVAAYEGPRSIADKGSAEFANQIYDGFSDIIGAFHDDNAAVVRELDDAVLRDRAQAVTDLSYLYDITSRLARMTALTAISGGVDPNRRLKTADLFSKRETVIARVLASLDGAPGHDVVEGNFTKDPSVRFRELVIEFLQKDTVDPVEVIKQAADQSEPNFVQAVDAARGALRARSDDLVDAAEGTRQRHVIVFLGSTLAALALALLFARSIARPLLSLTRQADEMAGDRLPDAVARVLDTPLGEDVEVPHLEPVTVRSHDEVADVAGALTTVQNRALDLAVEQAVLRRNIADSFVNLGRRTQNLVSRQLDFITQLEQNETDPKTLEDLFRLDHLATRIQRNAESLVVLAGMEAPRTWSQAVPMVDALRASLGEVEDYQRVRIERVDSVGLTGGVASDVVHLVAELLENGLMFSPPERTVELTGSRHDGGYRVQVIDHGIGMSAEDLAQANVRLAGSESFTVAPSKYLGHFVAGHLARRLGATVSLQAGEDRGVVATVDLPASVLASLDEAQSPAEEVAAPAPEVAAAVPAPATLAEAIEVDEEEIAAALAAEEPAVDPELVAGPTTAGGLARRVRTRDLPAGSPDADQT